MTSTQTRAPKPAPAITMNPVKSSNIAATGYDPHSKTLAITFKGGNKTYHYEGVSPDLFDQMHKAESVGKFVVAHVTGKFKHVLQQQGE